MESETLFAEEAEPPGRLTGIVGLNQYNDFGNLLSTISTPTTLPARPVPKPVVFSDGRARIFRKRFFPNTTLTEWQDWRWQLHHRIRDVETLGRMIRLSEDERHAISDRASSLPLFTANGGRVFRQCTWDFKVVPIRKRIRPMLAKGEICQMIRGISFDERHRAKPSDVKWAVHEHPLVDMGITRADCLRWMLKHGYSLPPRSACVYCPNRCNAEWQKMRDLAPDDWAEACRVDELMRNSLPGMKEPVFIHRQKVPLKEADLYADMKLDQLRLGDDGWADCEGLCGV
mgnify:CR=1 FL=1